jgi:LmbE family N-acetylglucosaminyl deacetylase
MNIADRESAGRYAFLFAHPDDEAFIAGTMKMLLDAGAPVFGIWTTSGDYFGGGAEREAEQTRAMDLLGLEPSRRILLRIPDLGVTARLNESAETVAEVFAEIRPDVVFCNAFEGGHPDHDCVNFLAYEASRRAGIQPELFEFPLYNGYGRFYHWWWKINSFPTDNPPVLHNPLNLKAVECKHAVMRAYAGQWFYMGPARLASPTWLMLSYGEPYRSCPPDRDHTVRPHPGKLGYERWFNAFMKINFKDYRTAVENARRNRPDR